MGTLFQKRSCERHFLRSLCLSSSQASSRDATIEGSPQGPTCVPTGVGGTKGTDPGKQPWDPPKPRTCPCPHVNELIPPGPTSPAALRMADKTPIISLGVHCSTVFMKTNHVRNQQQPQKNVFSHFFELFCLAILLRISSKSAANKVG